MRGPVVDIFNGDSAGSGAMEKMTLLYAYFAAIVF
jgi:hypothetical protein